MIKLTDSKVILITLSIILLTTIQCFGGPEDIVEQKMLGCYEETIPAPQITEDALRKMDSIKIADTKEKPYSYPAIQNPVKGFYPAKFKQYPISLARWCFTEDSCLNMFIVNTGVMPDEMGRDVFEYAIYNKCDSTIYHFGGDINAFSRVSKEYLQNKFTGQQIMELLRLYINTFSIESMIYILYSPAYIDSVFDEHIRSWIGDMTGDYGKQRKRELEKSKIHVKHLAKPLVIKESKADIVIEFYTWNYNSGKLEKWRFRATRESLELFERTMVAKDVEPFNYMGTE
jgi:hypothetical protein